MEEIGLYLHIPFCVKKCDYCDFLSGVFDERTQEAYTRALCEEIHFMGQQLPSVAVSSIYIGGGTPSWLNTEWMEKILHTLHRAFRVLPSAEISVECNPGTATRQKLEAYRRMGINRLSIGLQSANDDELKLLGRVHTFEHFLHTYDTARKCGFYNINVDIMTGLPMQTHEKLMHTLETVLQLKPEHISAYALMIEEGTPFYERYKFDAVKQHAGMQTECLPDEDLEYQLYKMTQHVLCAHGYGQYEISNYAREGYACRHNTIYWQRKPYIGMGLGAASLYRETRSANIRDIYDYISICDGLSDEMKDAPASPLWETSRRLTRKEAMEEYMFLGLRMNEGITRDGFYKAFGCHIDGIYGEVLRKLSAEELLVTEAGRIRLTDRGLDLSNYALAQFLLDKTDAETVP